MRYVIGVDLGTSAVKVLLVNQEGKTTAEASREYPLYHDQPGWSEQDPDDWVRAVTEALHEVKETLQDNDAVDGLSFSGQMHGLVLLDEEQKPLRRAILWNDTRTTAQCREIESKVGKKELHEITKNPALEGFTLPKLLWVKEHEPDVFSQADAFVLPKDYVRLKLTGELGMEYSDAAGTLLLDVAEQEWSRTICEKTGIPFTLCPPLTASHEQVGVLTEDIQSETGLSAVPVSAGGADNACGALGTGVLQEGTVLSSTGTSGVVLAYEKDAATQVEPPIHYFNHGAPGAYYTMGVTLAAGHSLTWFRETCAPEKSFDELIELAAQSPAGARGLLFTPYISGERTPHPDADIRASFIGLHASHTIGDMARAVLEGITFSLNESVASFRRAGKTIDRVIATGGGAKSRLWLQLQADIYRAPVVRLEVEQGPGLGAAMLAALGAGWFATAEEAAAVFVKEAEEIQPSADASVYESLFPLYQKVYGVTSELSRELKAYRG
ncbi:xylulokinase [Alkalicoccus urumqiensis]|uniref:Xylulose kinase n=1 Tax=Alkalicoccus urumqiensis TaxID=1548213 RepID=A0A2P6MIB9_ALKUR|nr:xylulokinase [Alkalicoccus urumqiensis]PRO66032.1 xylulokinase [Alkalicoccus urumqiensis]